MAVVDKYTNTEVLAGSLANPVEVTGADPFGVVATFEVAAADDNTSVYRCLKNIPSDWVIINAWINCDAITAGDDWDLGIYSTNSGAVKDADALVDGADLSSALIFGSEISGMSAVDIANVGYKIYEHAGDDNSSKASAYDIAFTANTVGTAAGTITLRVLFAQG